MHFWSQVSPFLENLVQLLILRLRYLLKAMLLESRKKSENNCSCKSATRLVRFAGKNVLKTCRCDFGCGNWRGLVGCDWISQYIPISFSFLEILYATCVSTDTVLIQSLMHLSSTCVVLWALICNWLTYLQWKYLCLITKHNDLWLSFRKLPLSK